MACERPVEIGKRTTRKGRPDTVLQSTLASPLATNIVHLCFFDQPLCYHGRAKTRPAMEVSVACTDARRWETMREEIERRSKNPLSSHGFFLVSVFFFCCAIPFFVYPAPQCGLDTFVAWLLTHIVASLFALPDSSFRHEYHIAFHSFAVVPLHCFSLWSPCCALCSLYTVAGQCSALTFIFRLASSCSFHTNHRYDLSSPHLFVKVNSVCALPYTC